MSLHFGFGSDKQEEGYALVNTLKCAAYFVYKTKQKNSVAEKAEDNEGWQQ